MRKVIQVVIVIAVSLVFLGDSTNAQSAIYDHHVHVMSPALIKYWKGAGVPFSREEKFYSDVSAISERLGTKKFNAVSMAYTWNNPEFGTVKNEREKVIEENDFILSLAKRKGFKIDAYCSVNVLAEYALEELQRCEKKGADGIKFHHNANQVYFTEPEHLKKALSLWQFAAEKKLRMLVHFDNSHPRFGKPDIRILFDEILAKIKPAKILFAHLGTSGGYTEKTKNVIGAFEDEFARASMHNRKHRIYFDLSAVALDKNSQGVSKLNDKEFKDLASLIRRVGVSRFKFGTDYPLYSAQEFYDILQKRVGLTKKELKQITSSKY